MASRAQAIFGRVPARATFYVVKQGGSTSLPGMITVLHGVPAGAEELGSFDNPNHAIDFAEAAVLSLNEAGSAWEMVDPPYGLVGAG